MPDAEAEFNVYNARFSGSARGVSDGTVRLLGLAAIGSFSVTAIVITLIIKLL